MSVSLPDPPQLSRKLLLLSLALIVLMGLCVYANSLNGQFLWDDESLIEYSPYIKDWSHLPKVLTNSIGSTGSAAGSIYRPVQIFSYQIDYSFWRLDVVGYHVMNMVWHILTALSVFCLIQILFQNGKISLITALLFVVHPLHTEAVSYVSGRADSLAAFFMLCAFILYLKHDQKGQLSFLGGMVISYLLALLSRENSLILPVLVGFYHFAFKKPVNKRAFTILVGTMAGYILWRVFVVGVMSVAEGAAPTLSQRLPGVFVALTNYYRLLFFPLNLHMEYGGIIFNFSEPKAIMGVILTACLFVLILWKRVKDPFLFFAAGWFFITLFPSLNVLFAINAYMAEHWLYIPSIGFFLIISRFLVRLIDRANFRAFAIMITTGLIIFYSTLTVLQNRYWNNDVSFYKRMLLYAPDSSRLYNNLAKAYHDEGKNDELIKLLRSAIQLQPDNVLAHNNLGNAYKETGRFDEAKRSYREAIRLDPSHAGPYYNLSTIYSDIDGNTKEAITLLNKAIEMSPYFPKSYNKLGLLYFKQGDAGKAITLLNKSLKLNPDDPETYHHLGYTYFTRGDKEKGIAMYLKSIEADPNYADGYYNLAVIYAQAGQFKKAIPYCDKAAALGYSDERLFQVLKPYR